MRALWTGVRRFWLWAIPGVLLAVLIWTFLPHPGPVPAAPPPPPKETAQHADPSGGAPPAPAPSPASLPSGVSLPPGIPSQEALHDSSVPYAEIRQGDLTGTDATGHARWRIVAEDVTVDQEKKVVSIRSVQATFYSQDGTTMTITAQQGTYDTQTREIELAGAVHGTTSTGRQLFADRMHWAPSSGLITGSGNVRLMEQRVTMYADRMVTSITLGQTQFFGHVHVAAQ